MFIEDFDSVTLLVEYGVTVQMSRLAVSYIRKCGSYCTVRCLFERRSSVVGSLSFVRFCVVGAVSLTLARRLLYASTKSGCVNAFGFIQLFSSLP